MSSDKVLFLELLGMAVFLIYTLDHLIDGWKSKGNSGIYRYDFHYNHRGSILFICVALFAFSIYLLLSYRETIFIQHGIWLIPVLCLYFILKFRGNLRGILKMLVISCIVSYVVVSLYSGGGFFSDFLSMERLLMTLIALMNQLVLENYEFHEDENRKEIDHVEFYRSMIKRVFVWTIAFLVISTFLNSASWPFTLSLFIVACLLWYISYKSSWFKINRRYRFFADFALVLVWPLLKLFLVFSTQLYSRF